MREKLSRTKKSTHTEKQIKGRKGHLSPGVVAHTCPPSSEEAEAGR